MESPMAVVNFSARNNELMKSYASFTPAELYAEAIKPLSEIETLSKIRSLIEFGQTLDSATLKSSSHLKLLFVESCLANLVMLPSGKHLNTFETNLVEKYRALDADKQLEFKDFVVEYMTTPDEIFRTLKDDSSSSEQLKCDSQFIEQLNLFLTKLYQFYHPSTLPNIETNDFVRAMDNISTSELLAEALSGLSEIHSERRFHYYMYWCFLKFSSEDPAETFLEIFSKDKAAVDQAFLLQDKIAAKDVEVSKANAEIVILSDENSKMENTATEVLKALFESQKKCHALDAQNSVQAEVIERLRDENRVFQDLKQDEAIEAFRRKRAIKKIEAAVKAFAKAKAKAAAATKIQSVLRGNVGRKQFDTIKAEAAAATRIQSVYRGHATRNAAAAEAKAEAEAKAKAASTPLTNEVGRSLSYADGSPIYQDAITIVSSGTEDQLRGFLNKLDNDFFDTLETNLDDYNTNNSSYLISDQYALGNLGEGLKAYLTISRNSPKNKYLIKYPTEVTDDVSKFIFTLHDLLKGQLPKITVG